MKAIERLVRVIYAEDIIENRILYGNINTGVSLQRWIKDIIHVSKPKKCTTAKANSTVSWELK